MEVSWTRCTQIAAGWHHSKHQWPGPCQGHQEHPSVWLLPSTDASTRLVGWKMCYLVMSPDDSKRMVHVLVQSNCNLIVIVTRALPPLSHCIHMERCTAQHWHFHHLYSPCNEHCYHHSGNRDVQWGLLQPPITWLCIICCEFDKIL